MIDKNLVDRHIPTLLKNANSKMQRLKLRINEFEKLKAEEVSKREQHQNNISDKDYEMKSINLDLENSVDPIANPLDTGQEVQRLEMWIREMESKVFYLQGDIALLKSQMLKCNQLIVTYKHHISILLTEIAKLQKEIDRLGTEDFLNRLLHNGSEYLKNDNIINMNKDGEILDNGEHD